MPEWITPRHFVYGKFTDPLPDGGPPDYVFLAVSSLAPADRRDFERVQSAVGTTADLLPRRDAPVRLVLPADHGWVYVRLFPGLPPDRAGRPVQRLHAVLLTPEEFEALDCRPWRLDPWLVSRIGPRAVDLPGHPGVALGEQNVPAPLAVRVSELPPVPPRTDDDRVRVALVSEWLTAGWNVYHHCPGAETASLLGDAFASRARDDSDRFGLALGLPPLAGDRSGGVLTDFESRTGVRLACFATVPVQLPPHWADLGRLTPSPATAPRGVPRSVIIRLAADAPQAEDTDSEETHTPETEPPRPRRGTPLVVGLVLLVASLAGNAGQCVAGRLQVARANRAAEELQKWETFRTSAAVQDADDATRQFADTRAEVVRLTASHSEQEKSIASLKVQLDERQHRVGALAAQLTEREQSVALLTRHVGAVTTDLVTLKSKYAEEAQKVAARDSVITAWEKAARLVVYGKRDAPKPIDPTLLETEWKDAIAPLGKGEVGFQASKDLLKKVVPTTKAELDRRWEPPGAVRFMYYRLKDPNGLETEVWLSRPGQQWENNVKRDEWLGSGVPNAVDTLLRFLGNKQ
jgi:hypothetical protein